MFGSLDFSSYEKELRTYSRVRWYIYQDVCVVLYQFEIINLSYCNYSYVRHKKY